MKKITIILLILGICVLIEVPARAQIELAGNYGLSFGAKEQPITIAVPTGQKITTSPTNGEVSPPEVRVDPILIEGDHLTKFHEEYRKTFPKGPDFGAKFTLNKDNKVVIHCLVPTPRDIQTAKNKGALTMEGCIIPYHYLEDTKPL